MREGGLARKDAIRILAQFQGHVDGAWYTKLTLEPGHYRVAKDWLGQLQWPLRTLDALHLAMMSSAPAMLVTADVTLASVAESLGIRTVRFPRD